MRKTLLISAAVAFGLAACEEAAVDNSPVADYSECETTEEGDCVFNDRDLAPGTETP